MKAKRLLSMLSLILQSSLPGDQSDGKNLGREAWISSWKKVLLLHMDDAGMCQEANGAVERYIQNGFLMSAAVMVPCPAAVSFIEWAKGYPRQISESI